MTRLIAKTILTAGLSALLGSLSLTAQTHKLAADIPFAFQAGGKVMPAGTYEFRQNSSTSGMFQVANREAKISEFVNASVPKHYMPKDSKLTFSRYGNEYVLTEISVAGTASTNGLMPSAIEKNTSRKLGFASMISVPLHAQ